MSKSIISSGMGVLFTVFLISCASFDMESLNNMRSSAENAKRLADDAKASNAVPDEYAVAKNAYEQAIAAEKAENFEEALVKYESAKTAFDAVAKEALSLQKAASEAMEAMSKAITENERKAEEAIKTALQEEGVN